MPLLVDKRSNAQGYGRHLIQTITEFKILITQLKISRKSLTHRMDQVKYVISGLKDKVEESDQTRNEYEHFLLNTGKQYERNVG